MDGERKHQEVCVVSWLDKTRHKEEAAQGCHTKDYYPPRWGLKTLTRAPQSQGAGEPSGQGCGVTQLEVRLCSTGMPVSLG